MNPITRRSFLGRVAAAVGAAAVAPMVKLETPEPPVVEMGPIEEPDPEPTYTPQLPTTEPMPQSPLLFGLGDGYFCHSTVGFNTCRVVRDRMGFFRLVDDDA